jgi:hypothetical protein
VEPLRDQFAREVQARSWSLHRYFHHLTSSQALAFNLFLPLYPALNPKLNSIRSLLEIGSPGPAKLDFEVVLPGGDGTNIDVLITEQDGRKTVMEVKLTESGFGRARNDLRHQKKLREVYTPLLRGRIADELLESQYFFRNYQLLRNLAQLRPGTHDRLLLVIPRARSRLWQWVSSWCAQSSLGDFCGKVTPLALEDLLIAQAADAQAGALDPIAVAATSAKYLFAAG